MADGTYDAMADVYEFFVPDAVLTPEGNAEAFAAHVATGATSSRRGGRVAG